MSQKTAVIYARVSSRYQRELGTIEAQMHACSSLVERHGLKLLKSVGKGGIIRDDGISGRFLSGRKGMLGLLDLIESGNRPDYIVVRDFERVFREDTDSTGPMTDKRRQQIQQSMSDAARIAGILLTHDVHILDEKYGDSDLRDPVKRAIVTLIAGLDGKGTKQKTDSGRRKRLFDEACYVFGVPPLGYRRQYKDVDRPRKGAKLVADPEGQTVLIRILTWFAEGGARFAAEQAKRAKIMTPRGSSEATNLDTKNHKSWHGAGWHKYRWTHHQVMFLARRAGQYATGRWTYKLGEETCTHQLAPLITDELWADVERSLKSRAAPTHKQRWTSGHLACRACGGPLKYRPIDHGKYPYYECNACKTRVAVKPVEADMWSAVVIRLAQVLSVQEGDGTLESIDQRMSDARSRLDALTSEIESLLELRITGGIDPAIWERKNAAKHAARSKVEAELRTLAAERARTAGEQAESRTVRDRIAELLGPAMKGGLEERRKVLGLVLDGGRMSLDKEGMTLPSVHGLPAIKARWGAPDLARYVKVATALGAHKFRFVGAQRKGKIYILLGMINPKEDRTKILPTPNHLHSADPFVRLIEDQKDDICEAADILRVALEGFPRASRGSEDDTRAWIKSTIGAQKALRDACRKIDSTLATWVDHHRLETQGK